MCAMAIAAARVCTNLADLACADLPLAELGAAVSATLCRLAPHEGFCLIGFDPVSGLRSFQTASNALVGVERGWRATNWSSRTSIGSPSWRDA